MSWFIIVAGAPVLLFVALVVGFRSQYNRDDGPFYFDPQDTFKNNSGNRMLPASAENATFEPMLKHYIGVTQLLVTVAAASIAFAENSNNASPRIAAAKVILAWSIVFGVAFCALLLWRYDEYSQDAKSYTLSWYSFIHACGFACLLCFIFGYGVWGFGLLWNV